jgi:putative inorganic carbon (HCO3(-)) transporter
VFLVAIVLLAAPPTYYQRMSTMTDTQESSARGRIDAWWLGVDMAIDNPILGAGAGQFPMMYGRSLGRWTTAHSVYFLTLGELGFPGIAVLLTLMISQFFANRRMVKEVRRVNPPEITTYINALSCTSASLLGFAVGGAFLSATYYPHLYVLCGLLVATRGIVKQQLETAAVTAQQPDAADVVVRPPLRPGAISPDWRPARALGSGTLSRRMLSPHSKR